MSQYSRRESVAAYKSGARHPEAPGVFDMSILQLSSLRLALSGFVGGLAAYVAWIIVDYIFSLFGWSDGKAMASAGHLLSNGAGADGGGSLTGMAQSAVAGGAGAAAGGATYQATGDTWGIRVDPPPGKDDESASASQGSPGIDGGEAPLGIRVDPPPGD